MRRKGFILITILATVFILGACAKPTIVPVPEPAPIPVPTPTPTPTPEPVPAEFEVISLDIVPLEIIAGETADITAIVKNTGGTEGTYGATLIVDRVVVETKEVLITPGISETVTFPLLKEAPGTYEVSVGELSLNLIVREMLELKHDDGRGMGATSSSGPGWGYSVRFSPSTIPFTIFKVKVFARLRSGYVLDTTSLEIWDRHLNVLYSTEKPAIEYSSELEWVIIDIPNITVNDDFRVVFFTNGEDLQAGGVGIGYDLSGNKGSEMARANGTIGEWPAPMEATRPRDSTNWMIRVVGAAAEEGTTITPPLSQGGEFEETVALLDNPQKLSRWMLDNTRYESEYEKWRETGVDYIAPPEETFNSRVGNCADFAVFAFYVLESHGYDPELLRIAVESDISKNHVVCVYQSSASLYTINNGIIEGPFTTYEDIAFEHDETWSQYDVYYSWNKFQEFGYPDEVVYRE